jgi:hypothetical protein
MLIRPKRSKNEIVAPEEEEAGHHVPTSAALSPRK